MSPLRALALHVLLILGMIGFDLAQSAGDPSRHSEPLPDLVLGPEAGDQGLSRREYQLEAGKAYRLRVISTGRGKYSFRAPGFASSIFLRKVEAGSVEVGAALAELEFEAAGGAEIFFVPSRPGKHRFFAKGPEGRDMQGAFVVR